MVNQQLIDYVKSLMIKGFSPNQIYGHLVRYRYAPEDAAAAINLATGNPSTVQMQASASSQEPAASSGKKSIRLLPILLIIIVVLAIAGAAFFFKPFITNLLKGAVNNEMLNSGADNIQEAGVNDAEAPNNEIAGPAAGSSQGTEMNGAGTLNNEIPTTEMNNREWPEEDVAEQENCGAVDNMHIFAEPEKATDYEKGAMACFSESLLGCYPSTFEFSGEGGDSYQVIGPEGDACLVSGGGKTCKIPISFIQESQAAADEEGAPEMAFIITIFAMAMGDSVNSETGDMTNIECY